MNAEKLTRRGFVGGSMACVAGLAAVGSAFASEASEPAWDQEVDVLVVGSGACGLMAGAYCAHEGYEVTVIDAAPEIGGCSILSGGGCSWGAPFDMEGQPEEDKVLAEDALAGLTNVTNPTTKKNDPEVTATYVENVAGTLQFILECGAKPQANGAGSVAFPMDETNPGPGLPHSFLGEDGPKTLGSGLIRPLESSFTQWGGGLVTGCKLTALVMGADGACVGVEADMGGEPVRYHARKAVVLACGGWKGSPVLRRAFDPRLTPDLPYTGYPYALDDGSALIAAYKAGACFASDQSNDSQLFRTKYATPWYNFAANSGVAAPGIQPTTAQAASYIYVNANGERFFNEAVGTSSAEYADVLLQQPDHLAWMVFDAAGLEECGWDLSAPESDESCVFSADTLEGLADAMGVPQDGLTAAVADYNAAVEAGVDEQFDKPADKLTQTLGTAPFYAVTVRMFIHDSAGGLCVDGNRRVINLDGGTIDGLYAGGDAVGGNSKIGLARATTDGYIIGRSICEA